VKKDLAQAIEALKKIPSRTALQELDDMLTGGGGMEWGAASNTIDTVSRAEALQKTKFTLKEIEEVMIEKFVPSLPSPPPTFVVESDDLTSLSLVTKIVMNIAHE
jgi:hypothetical protein